MPSNYERASWALSSLNTFTRMTMSSSADQALKVEGAPVVIGDLLADILHLCDQRGYDFEACLESGRSHFSEEKREEAIDVV